MVDPNSPQGVAERQQIQVVNQQGLGLAAQFFWVQDRFQHTIDWLTPSPQQTPLQQPLLASEFLLPDATLLTADVSVAQRNDGGNEQWPADPPLQQLSVEPIGDRDAVLAVGQAGCGHWSSSVEAYLQDDHPTLKFDVACRFSRPAEYLGSQYRLVRPELTTRREGQDAMLAFDAHHLRFSACSPSASGASPLAWQLADAGQRLRLRVDDGAGALPRTVRWQFTVSLVLG